MFRKEFNVQTGQVTSVPLTDEEIAGLESFQRDVMPDLLLKQVEKNRTIAYRAEADPLFFKYQAGEVTKEEWLAKREEIKVRYPYPS